MHPSRTPPRLPPARLTSITLAALLAAPTLRAQGGDPLGGRVSVEASALGTLLPNALRDETVCGGSTRAGLGLALGAGYRLRAGLRAEARLGAFGQPGLGNADCVTAPAAAPLPSRPSGTVERSVGFDPQLADRRAFTQGRLVADLPTRTEVLRASVGAGTLLRIRAPFVSAGAGFGGRVAGAHLLLEAEQWWMRAPTVDRTITWEAQPLPAVYPPGTTFPTAAVVTAERRSTRGLRATWVRLSATLPLPGT